MKKSNYFKISTLALPLSLISILNINCSDTKELFNIDSKNIKAIYKTSESVNLVIENKENETIDSVVYFNNEKKISTTLNNKPFQFNLNNQKLGLQNVKAIIYSEGKNYEEFTSFEIVSSITPKVVGFELINTFPHDKDAYTQGLEFYNGNIIEGTGQYGESSLRKTNYKDGSVTTKKLLENNYFGEGITVFKNKIYQLTWREKTGFIYDASTFEKIKSFTFFKDIEGWGLTHNDKHLIMSDGTNTIYFLNPETLEIVDFINVSTDSSKIDQINELEWIDGKIWANIYQKDAIAIINPNTGAVEKVINLESLKSKITNPQMDVLNGIAYNPTTKTVFVTGKNWDKMFEIQLKE